MDLALLELLQNENHDGGDVGHSLDNNGAPVTAATDAVTDSLVLPMVSTPAGPVPGILILRQNKKRKLRGDFSINLCEQSRLSIAVAKKKDAVVVNKASAETAKEIEAKTDAVVTTATVVDANGSSNNSSSSNSNSFDSNANEASNGNESNLNTSTGSNSSGVSSNSSNAAGHSNNGANGGGDSGGAGGNGSGGGGGGGVHMKEQLIYLSKLLEFEVSSV